MNIYTTGTQTIARFHGISWISNGQSNVTRMQTHQHCS